MTLPSSSRHDHLIVPDLTFRTVSPPKPLITFLVSVTGPTKSLMSLDMHAVHRLSTPTDRLSSNLICRSDADAPVFVDIATATRAMIPALFQRLRCLGFVARMFSVALLILDLVRLDVSQLLIRSCHCSSWFPIPCPTAVRDIHFMHRWMQSLWWCPVLGMSSL